MEPSKIKQQQAEINRLGAELDRIKNNQPIVVIELKEEKYRFEDEQNRLGAKLDVA